MISNLSQFVPVLKRLKYLENFQFDGFYYDGPPPVHLFVDLPIICITANEFKFVKEKLPQIIDTLTQIKTLKAIQLNSSEWGDYKLSAEDFSLFKHLPVTFVGDNVLDISKETVPFFREIISKGNGYFGKFRSPFR